MNPRVVPASASDCLLPYQAIVGESPVWDPGRQRVYWIDIQGKQVHRFDPRARKNESFPVPEVVTCIQLRATGGLVMTLKKSFAFFDPDSGRMTRLASVEDDRPDNRFNDGKCDPQGRLWAGTMNAKRWDEPSGNLYRMTADRMVARLQSQVACSNGSGWSPDGRTMYHTESFRYAVFAYDFDPVRGEIDNRRVFVGISEEDRRAGGFPDGLTVDAEGCVWSCQVGLGRIVRYDPEGKIERIVQLPIPRPTDCTFGGEDLKTLFITSARETMSPDQLRQVPLSGSLFGLDAGVRGLPPTPFVG